MLQCAGDDAAIEEGDELDYGEENPDELGREELEGLEMLTLSVIEFFGHFFFFFFRE